MRVTRHYGGGTALLYGELKGLEIKLSHTLLICPDGDGKTIRFLIVQRKMLRVAINALSLCACDLRGAELAGEKPVLGVILKISAGEGSAVNVHARSIETDDAVCYCLSAEDLTELAHKLNIPRCADDRFRGEGNASQRGNKAVYTGGAVKVACRRLADRFNRRGRPSAVEDHIRHILVGELLQKKLPLGIAVAETRHILKCQAVICVDNRRVRCVHSVGSLVCKGVRHSGGGLLAVHALLRECAGPVGTAQVSGYLTVLNVREKGLSRSLIGASCVAVAVDYGAVNGVLTGVNYLVGVLHKLYLISSRFEDVSSGVFGVEGRHILSLEGDSKSLALTGLEELRLTEACKNDVRLFNSALGIGGGIIDLSHVLSSNGAGVRDLD